MQLAAGLGLALVGVPLLAALDPRLVPAPFLAAALPLLYGQWRADRGAVPPGLLGPAVAGLALGTAAGMALALGWPGLDSRRGYGVVVLAAVVLAALAPPLRPGRAALAGTGFASGVMGGLAGVHGPLMGLALSHLPAPALRGTLGAVWCVAFLLVLAMAILAGRADPGDLALSFALLPGFALGVLLARPARRWLHGARLRRAVLALSAAGGALLVALG